jgi:hypothetical protein
MINRQYALSANSKKILSTVTPALQEIVTEGLYIANLRKLYCPDFAITRGLTTAEEQFKLFMIGRQLVGDNEYIIIGKTVTNCDGYINISDHQKVDKDGKALAFDFVAWVDGKISYDDSHMASVATVFYEAASNKGRNIEWGGNYKSISDGAHVGLII